MAFFEETKSVTKSRLHCILRRLRKMFSFALKLKLTIAIIERKEKAEKTARHMYFSLAFIVWSTQKGVGKI